jgi:hypothetical protein
MGREFNRWDQLHYDSKKNLTKRDVPLDEASLRNQRDEYTF